MVQKIMSARKGHTYIQWTAALLANCMTISYGLECGWISPLTKILQSSASPVGELSDSALAWAASALSLTATIGTPVFAYVADVYGSKSAVILLSIPQAVSWLLKILYPSSASLIAARIISGLAAGGVFNVVPLYVKEISQDNMRGVLGSLLALGQNTGIFVMYLMGAYMDYYTVMYIALALPIAAGLLMLIAPESPAFLVKHGKIKEAIASIALLRGLDEDNEEIRTEVENMRREEFRFQALPNISMLAAVKEPIWRRGLILVICMFTFHGINGAYVLITYASAILVSTGVQLNISSELQTLSLPFLMIVASLLLTCIVERFGRKYLLSAAFLVTFASMLALGIAILVQRSGGTVPSWLPVISMVAGSSMYAFGVSPLPYIITTELFSYQCVTKPGECAPTLSITMVNTDVIVVNIQVRAKMMGVAVTYAWLTTSLTVAVYPPIASSIGQYATFFGFAAINLLGAVLVLIFIPETKGKCDEEIRRILAKENKDQRISNS